MKPISEHDVDGWRAGARFALEAVSKVDSICWLTDSMRAVCIKQAADAVIAEIERMSEPSNADEWYLQDTRSYVGNDVVFWAKDGRGYTTDVIKAHVYTRDAADRQAAARHTDRPWPKAYIDGKTRPAVDMQFINYADALKPTATRVELEDGSEGWFCCPYIPEYFGSKATDAHFSKRFEEVK